MSVISRRWQLLFYMQISSVDSRILSKEKEREREREREKKERKKEGKKERKEGKKRLAPIIFSKLLELVNEKVVLISSKDSYNSVKTDYYVQ